MDPIAPEDVEAEMAAFHRAARKRKAVIFGVAGALMLAIGAIVTVFTLLADAPDDSLTVARSETKLLLLGTGLVVGGLGSAYNAYRIGSGQIDDVES